MRLISKPSQRIQAIALPLLAFILTFSWLGLSGCATTAESEKAKPKPAADTSSKPLAKKVEVQLTAEGKIVEKSSAIATVGALDQGKEYLEIDPANFDERSTIIDNEWWPIKPGTQLVYEGYNVEDGEKVPHTIVDTVTDLTKVINGVRTVVSLEEDLSKGKLEEREIAFHAQDKDGNVWHLGQHREMYDDRELLGYRTWLVGHLNGAKAGIRMLAKPRLGALGYSQGYAPPPFNWTDRGRVYQMGKKTKVPTGNYNDVMVIEEWDAETSKGIFQTKYYAQGVGIVRIGYKGNDPEKEEMSLVRFVQLSPEALAEAREKALKVEERAYVFGSTPPAERNAGAGLVMNTSDGKITKEKAKEIALKAVPGDVMDVSIETKHGANRYVVEVIAKEDRSETDVIIDMETGKILATEK